MTMKLPDKNRLTICFAHVAYRLHERFSVLGTGIASFAVRDAEALTRGLPEADVLVISGLWHDELLDRAPLRLRYIQSIGAGTDQFPREALAGRGIRLASARGVNARAVAEHAMALILALSRASAGGARQPGAARLARYDRRSRPARGRAWRQDAADRRPGDIGFRLARLAKAFDMRVHRAAPRSGRRRRRTRTRFIRWRRWVRCCPRPILSR